MYCRECGKYLPDEAKYCAYCGVKQEEINEVQETDAYELQNMVEDEVIDDISHRAETFTEQNATATVAQMDDETGVYAFGEKIEGRNMADYYTKVLEKILEKYPELIGQFETLFTTDEQRAEKYTGSNKYIVINGEKVAINTGNNNAAKRNNIKRIVAAAGLTDTDIIF